MERFRTEECQYLNQIRLHGIPLDIGADRISAASKKGIFCL